MRAHRFAPALAALLVGAAAGQTSAVGGRRPAAPDSSLLVIAGPREPGVRMVVSGRVLDAADRRPLAGVRVGVYHTDASGQYGVHPTRRSFPPNRDARLSGWLKTDRTGHFEIRTIRPGAYPGGGTPEHMHFIVGGRGQEMRFADDPLILRLGTGSFESPMVTIKAVRTDGQGVQHVTLDLRHP